MNITEKEVLAVANLARLKLDPAEVSSMTEQLDRILGYVAKLNEINTDGVEATSHAQAVTNAFREDELKESLPRSEALANAPKRNEEAFIVPRVI
ncbi:MAG: Asp-tRNA(Asn)/Glu-tRNA(Gln) amidotransferase subunit GatC [Desulfobulbaceae bacterium]|uniref:Aspartyl/glutamyl-tRNA(Asn/Gln) amidotransferase subunit C n=1 Tax=Candidatus Desulfobia pelagia TaxID=2841692 RepID=A0A8J6TCJ7_9BACT|nr:Asp-tRNA(Asn)/Glu-tRNA(Gln) amidotransferase subunit GatC [Candidatus Desulfobia pelagia]